MGESIFRSDDMFAMSFDSCWHTLAVAAVDPGRLHWEHRLDAAGNITGTVKHEFTRVRYHCAKCGAQFYRDFKTPDFDPAEPTYDRMVAL